MSNLWFYHILSKDQIVICFESYQDSELLYLFIMWKKKLGVFFLLFLGSNF